jgi:serine/threonine-protein kinase
MNTQSPIAPSRYKRIAEIARGGMGIVYLALAREADGSRKLCVLKELKPHLLEDAAFVEMFLDEARLAARLRHPNVVETQEIASEENRPFIVMEFLEGQTFHRLLARAEKMGTPLPLELKLRVISQALAGLHYAHELGGMGLVHRDVSPHNVFVTYDGVIKLLDFGIAKAAGASHVTRAGLLKGKITYMAPEQARGGKVDRRADIFSVGVMLWEAIAGRRMWQGESELSVLHAIAQGRLPSLYDAKPESPVELLAICERALASSPDDRYPNAAALRDDLESWLGGMGRARELGALTSRLFHRERAQIDSIVERQVRAADEEDSLGLPILPQVKSGTHSIAPRTSGTAPALIASQRPAPPPLRAVPIVTAVAAVASVTLLAIMALPREAARPLSTVGRVEIARPVLPSADIASRVHVTVRAAPASARIWVDDVEQESNPATTSFARDGVTHVIRIEADGYQTKRETIAAERDALLSVTLDRRPVTAMPPRPSPPTATAHPRPLAREIDKSDPYAPRD